MYIGTSAIGNQSSRLGYVPHKKIGLRSPVRSVHKLAGIDTSDAMNGKALSNPN